MRSTLTRAFAAEADARRLRNLCEVMYHLSRAHIGRTDTAEKATSECASSSKGDEDTGGHSAKRQRTTSEDQQHDKTPAVFVPCSELLYTQDSCRPVFADGTRLDVVTQQLISQEIDPLQDPWFLLDVVEWGGRLYSIDNRRLYCLHQYQKHVGDKAVKIRVRIHRWLEIFDRFWMHYTTRNGGLSIRIRG